MKNTKNILLTFALVFVFSAASFAQNISLPQIGGGNFSLDAQKGKVVVLAVGATWLPLSKSQANITAKLAKQYAGRDVVFYFVTTESDAVKSKNYASDEQIQTFAERNKMALSILRDSDGATTLKKFKIDQLPSFIVFDKNGKIAAEPYGGLTPTPNAEKEFVVQLSKKIDEIL